ncbi:hypothetical protein [Prosthecobacter sp.]|uniref:hypothetical protein n=1 Tax=Prosthecobacter sp. TaxID=1965333 RepID=UPI002489C2F7|nr:hypothetical protein [Prosthecobacter sp.]MDI1314267.1 hypothetical protein [Prosthecobacter sp.]
MPENASRSDASTATSKLVWHSTSASFGRPKINRYLIFPVINENPVRTSCDLRLMGNLLLKNRRFLVHGHALSRTADHLHFPLREFHETSAFELNKRDPHHLLISHRPSIKGAHLSIVVAVP